MGKKVRSSANGQLLLFSEESGPHLGGNQGFEDAQDFGLTLVNQGEGSLAAFGANCLLFAFGAFKQGRSKIPYEFRQGAVLGITGRTEDTRFTSPTAPELCFIEQAGASGRLPTMRQLSDGGQIQCPLLIAGGYEADDEEVPNTRAYVHVRSFSRLCGVRKLKLAASVDRAGRLQLQETPCEAVVVSPPVVFLCSHEVGINGGFPYSEEYASSYLWLEVIQPKKDSRRWYGIQSAGRLLPLPKLGWQRLLAATAKHEEDATTTTS